MKRAVVKTILILPASEIAFPALLTASEAPSATVFPALFAVSAVQSR